ncbi:MAG: hypothetical protein BIFFINMI_02872 [Phycisphaerae bacterium]|nr:hypothetical protein [Phycisphaerae bacterium]
MDNLVKSNAAPIAQAEPAEFCSYCGAQLFPGFYFCTVCATPYKSVELVVPAARPRTLTTGELVEMKAPRVASLFWTYFSVVVAVGIFSLFALEGLGVQTIMLVATAAMLVVTCVFTVMYWQSLAVQFRNLGFLSPWAWVALAILPPLLAVNWGYHEGVRHLLGGLLEDADKTLGSQMGRTAMVICFCVFPAVLEEIAFRGLVQHWLQVAITPAKAIVIASALFTVLHFNIISAPYLFGVGLLLGWAKYKTGSLYPSILIHFLHNFVVVVYFQGP